MATISEFAAAVNQICAERGIDPDEVYEALESAILAAYKKDFGGGETMHAEVDRATGEIKLIADKEVVTDVTDEDTQIDIVEARKMEPNLEEGDHVEIEISIPGFGRIATQTAKQVILQKMRESEKEAVVEEFKEKMGTVITGLVQRMMGPTAVVEIGKAVAYMPPEEQIPNEFYKIGERYKFLLKEIREGQEMIVSRGAPEFLEELFKLEVPEMESGAVEIKETAREAGSRSKVAVVSHQDGVDPIGSCVGQRGMRIANVMSELGEEKIDIIEWAEEIEDFIANALGPAQVEKVEIIDEGVARVTVSDEQLSLAIGKDGQNVRLAAKLTGHKIDITAPGLDESKRKGLVMTARPELELSSRVMNALEKAGITVSSLLKMEDQEITEIPGIGPASLEEIISYRKGIKTAEPDDEKEAPVEDGATDEAEDAADKPEDDDTEAAAEEEDETVETEETDEKNEEEPGEKE
jgi:transcription termination/antitermination protein NusA